MELGRCPSNLVNTVGHRHARLVDSFIVSRRILPTIIRHYHRFNSFHWLPLDLAITSRSPPVRPSKKLL